MERRKDNYFLKDNTCFGKAALIFQFLVWILIIILNILGFLLSKAPEKEKYPFKITLIALGSIVLPILLIFYYIFEFTSDIFEYLKTIRRKGKITNIIDFLKEFFKKEPVISFKVKNINKTYGGYDVNYKTEYEYEYGDHYREIGYTKIVTREETWNKDKEIITTNLINSIPFSIYSFRDISESLIISNRTAFLELDITEETYFADKISLLDAKNEMEKIQISQNDRIDFEMEKKDFQYYYLIINDSIFLNLYMFVFFVIIGLGEPYKCYLKSICDKKYLLIKKIVSTRNDLFSDSNNKLYQNLNPIIIYKNVNYKYKNDSFGNTKINYHPAIPSKAEIEESNNLNEKDEEKLFKIFKNTNANANKLNNEIDTSDFSNEYKVFI